MHRLDVLLACLLFVTHSPAQTPTDVWSLQRCVQYAVDHNISIKQDSLTARLARYTLLQSKLSQLPTFNANGSYGRSFGRSVNPTTNTYVDASYNFLSLGGNGNLLVFGWMQVRNTIARNRFALEADMADLDQLRDDVSVNVANGFLTALLAKEQIKVSANQVKLTGAQLDQTRAFAEAGRLPELNVAQLESQMATDSSNLINSIANYNSAVLDLKTMLNLDFATPLDVQVPEVEPSQELMLSMTPPDEIYKKARMHFGSIKGSQLRVASAEKGLKAAEGNRYPQFVLGYQVGTNWANNYESYSSTPGGYEKVGYTDTIGGVVYPVYAPFYKTKATTIPFNTQIGDNFRQMVTFGVNVPIFSAWQSQYSVRQARISLAQQQLNEYNAELTLKQNVYKAHNNAVNSLEKYKAAKRANDAAARALEFARKRYDLGLTSTVDLLVTQNQAFNAASNLISAKYDLIFKLKVIDYYLGKELKL